jgi:hypothetical protein
MVESHRTGGYPLIALCLAAPSAGAFEQYPCYDTFTAAGHRCPYDMSNPSFWNDRHSWSYNEAWGGQDGWNNTNCEEVWRWYNHNLLSRRCWGGLGYAESGSEINGNYYAIADAWDDHVSYIGGVDLWDWAHTP